MVLTKNGEFVRRMDELLLVRKHSDVYCKCQQKVHNWTQANGSVEAHSELFPIAYAQAF